MVGSGRRRAVSREPYTTVLMPDLLFGSQSDNIRPISSCDPIELEFVDQSLVGVVGLTADDVDPRQQQRRQSVIVGPYA